MRPESKLAVFAILGALFGMVCIAVGAGRGDHWLLGAGVAATGCGLWLAVLMLMRHRAGA